MASQIVATNVKGTVTYNDIKKSKKGNNMRVVKVLQVDSEGNGATFPLYLSDVAILKDAKLGQEITLPAVRISGEFMCSLVTNGR